MPHKISYLIRNFVIGLIFFALLYFTLYQFLLKGNNVQSAPKFLIFFGFNTIAYPFAKAIYDSVAGFFIVDRIYVVSGAVSLIMRFLVYWFALFIAPLYLLFFLPSAINFIKNKVA